VTRQACGVSSRRIDLTSYRGDAVLVKGSRAAGLELVAETLPALLEVERVEG